MKEDRFKKCLQIKILNIKVTNNKDIKNHKVIYNLTLKIQTSQNFHVKII